MTSTEMARESWETEGIRHLEDGNRVPTPEERYLRGYLNGCMDTELRLVIPEGSHVALLEVTDEEVE